MKKLLYTILFLIILNSASVFPVYDETAKDVPSFVGYVEDEFIVVANESVVAKARKKGLPDRAFSGITAFKSLEKKFRVTHVRPQFARLLRKSTKLPTEKKLSKYFKVRFKKGTLENAMAAYANHPMIESVEPIGIHMVCLVPNDPFYTDPPPEFPYDQWDYWAPYGIAAETAWDIETGSKQVVVGVLDTGVRYFHKDLGGSWEAWSPWGPDDPHDEGNVWINPGEIPGNGIDDEGNGYTDDTLGWDFVEAENNIFISCIDQDCVSPDNDPDDGNGHGTHVAGTISAITNNDKLVSGIAGGYSDGTVNGMGNGVRVLPLRIGYHASYFGIITGVVRMDWAAEAMDYVADQVDRGVNVTAINCSWGSTNDGGISAAVDNLLAHDVMVVVAAGNGGTNVPDYLGSRGDCLDVAATDSVGVGPYWTNYGDWVDVAAPGVDILSTYRNPDDTNPYAHYISVLSGTSMAAPHVAGIAALLESNNVSLTGPQKFQNIVTNVIPYNDSRYLGSGIANAKLALDVVADDTSPPTPNPATWQTFPYATGTSSIAMTATTGSDPSGPVEYYFDETSGNPGGTDSGWQTSFSYTDSGLDPETTYTYRIRMRDAVGNIGVYSTLESATTDRDGGIVQDYANVDIAVSGSVSGSYVNTWDSDDSYESITETETGGRPRRRYSYLEHKWTIDVIGGTSMVFYVEAYHSASSDGDNFVFAYSTDDVNYTNMLTVTQTSDDNSLDGYILPSTISGTVYIRVRDTDRIRSHRSKDTIYVDQMFIESGDTGVGCTPTDCHVDSIVCSVQKCGRVKREGVVSVTILDDCGNTVTGATVTGTFYGDLNETQSAVTDGTGVATLITSGCVKRPSYTFCVDSVESTLPHDFNDNVETCDVY